MDQASAHHLGALARLAAGRDVHGEAEPVEQLRAELALLGVHRADQHEPRRVGDRHALPFHRDPAHRGGVQQGVHQVVGQQVHFVHIEQSAVRGGEQPRLEIGAAVAQRAFQIQGTDHAILGRADRHLHQPRGPGVRVRARRVRAVRARRVGVVRITREPAAAHDVDVRQ